MKRQFAVALVVFGLLAGSIGTAAAMPVGSPTMPATADAEAIPTPTTGVGDDVVVDEESESPDSVEAQAVAGGEGCGSSRGVAPSTTLQGLAGAQQPAQFVAARVRTCISVFVPFNPKKRLSGEFAFGGISVSTNPQRNLFVRVNRSRGTPHVYTVEITNPQGVDVANNCGTPSVTSTAPMLAPAIAVNPGTRQVIGYVNNSNNYDFTVTITCDLP